MFKRICSLVLVLVLVTTLTGQTMAVALPAVEVNGESISMDAPVAVINQTTYVSYWPVVKAFYPDATALWENDRAVVRAEGLHMEIQPGANYLIANGRYLYIPDGVRLSGSILTVPVRVLGRALGLEVGWNSESNTVTLTATGAGPITAGSVAYEEDVLYWLSHIIFAESGNQPLEGQIAVGNVIMNRVNSPIFPNTVYEVIHQKSQFTPVKNGTINLEPRELSIIAAKLVLDGANTAGNSVYFINHKVSGKSWVARTRTHITTIAAHAFYL